MIKVSLYIPCFNAEGYIRSCLEAVLKQTYPIEEILVIDDGSEDRTEEVASQFPVRVIRHSENRGLASVRNTAIRNTRSYFLASLDADCFPEKDWLGNLMRNFSSRVAGAGGRLLESQEDNPMGLWRAAHMKQEWGDEKSDSISFLFGSNNVFRKKFLLDAGRYNEGYLNNYEDVDISRRVKRMGYVLIYDPQALVHHMRRDDFFSILNTFWSWNFGYHQEKGYYNGSQGLYLKVKENIGLANRFIEEDFYENRIELLYLDLLLSIYLSLKDFFFSCNKEISSQEIKGKQFYEYYLSLLDLTFFYHLDFNSRSLRTFIPCGERFSQNLLVFLVLSGKVLMEKNNDHIFLKRLLRYFLESFVNDGHAPLEFLLKRLLVMLELHSDWNDFLKKGHPNLDRRFLKVFSENFQKSLNSLAYKIPDLFGLIKQSQDTLIKKEGR